MSAPTCNACLKSITDKDWVKSSHPATYHTDCFKGYVSHTRAQCNECHKVVSPKEKYFEIPSPSPRIPWIVRCNKCQSNYNCAVCSGTIAVLVHKKHEGKLYHTDCWRCMSCYGTMGKTPITVDGQLFCTECADKGFKGVCTRCNKSCRGDFTEAMDKQWHKDCLTCFQCKAAFPDGNFYVVKDQPACKRCAEAAQ